MNTIILADLATGVPVEGLLDAAGSRHPGGFSEYPTHVGDGTAGDPSVLQIVDLAHGLPVVGQTGFVWDYNLKQYGGVAVGAGNAVHVQPGTAAVFVVSDGGGSITVDGTVTANLGTVAGLALDATLTGGSQVAKPKTVTLSGTGINNNDLLVASTDVSDYRSGSAHITCAVNNNNAPIVQFSNDGTNWVGCSVFNLADSLWKTVVNQVTNAVWTFPVHGKFMRVIMAGTSANQYTATVQLSSNPLPPVSSVNLACVNSSFANALAAPSTADGANIAAGAWLQGQSVPVLANSAAGSAGDRQRNNHEVTVQASGAQAVTFNSADQINFNARGVQIVINVSAQSGTTPTLDAKIQAKDTLSGQYVDVPGAAFTQWAAATGAKRLVIFPGATPVANAKVDDLVPRVWRIAFTIGGTTPSFTLSAAANYVL